MFKNAMLFAVSSIAIIAFVPEFLPMLKPAPPVENKLVKAEPAPAAPEPAPAPVQQHASANHEVSIPSDGHGQYVAEVMLNGQPVRMLVDTGASFVTLSASVAARLGLRPAYGQKPTMFRTANGTVAMQATEVSSIAIGPIYMTGVRAFLAGPDVGEVNLIGENFLKRLAGVEQRDGWLYLRQ